MRNARVEELVMVILPLDCWVSTDNRPRQRQRGSSGVPVWVAHHATV